MPLTIRYSENSKVISESLRNGGGYKRAADEIFELKECNGITE